MAKTLNRNCSSAILSVLLFLIEDFDQSTNHFITCWQESPMRRRWDSLRPTDIYWNMDENCKTSITSQTWLPQWICSFLWSYLYWIAPGWKKYVKRIRSFNVNLISLQTRVKQKVYLSDKTVHSYLRACLHGGGKPQEDEVTRLGGVKKITRVYMQSYNPAILGCKFIRLLNGH